MNIDFTCMQCVKEKLEEQQRFIFEMRDDNIYKIQCNHGHENIIIFQHHKFEILYDMGIYAMLDGYFREAVSNFASSLERFYEFSIEIFSTKNNVDLKEYEKAWNIISKQSERQLGAYIMLYLNTFLGPPNLLSTKYIEFRNEVTHKGKIPSSKETYEYAEAVFNFIKDKLVEIKNSYNDILIFVYEKALRNYIIKNDVNNKNLISWGELMTFNSIRPVDEIGLKDFNQVIEQCKNYKPFKK